MFSLVEPLNRDVFARFTAIVANGTTVIRVATACALVMAAGAIHAPVLDAGGGPEHPSRSVSERTREGAHESTRVDIRPDTEVASPAPAASATGSPVSVTGASEWHAAGIAGDGVKVAVIDYFDVEKYWHDTFGPRPVAGVTARCFHQGTDCTAEFFDGVDAGGEDHGVAVVELIREIAPEAEIFIGRATTLDDYSMLVDWFAGRGVRIVNRSLGSRYDGPGDGRGPLGDVAASAVAKGMTWINSAGNGGKDKYYRHAVRLADGNVVFGAAGEETFLEATGCLSLAGMRWANDWDRPPGERTDYNLYLWESPTGAPATGSIIARSEFRQAVGAPPIELLSGNRCPAAGHTLYLEVRWRGGDITGDVLEILDHGNGFTQHTQAAYSAAVAIVDSDLAGVVSVGAIDPPESESIATYSSQGPTNDGRIAPHITAPSGFDSTVYGGRFSGTSAAAAVATGAAALLVDAGLAGDASSLGDLLRHTTLDRGAAGPDNVFGHGSLQLPAPPPAPVQAAPSRYVPLAAPMRFLDTRTATAVGHDELIGATWAGEIRRLPVAGIEGIPATATSVAINLATVGPDRRSYVQAFPLWQSSVGGYSNLNTDDADQNRANFAIIPIAQDGTIALYSTAAGHLVVDVLGWFEPVTGPVAAGRFVELPAAQRLVDTRTDGTGPVPSGSTIRVPNPAGVPLHQVDALVVTVTAVRPTAVGWLQAFPAARDDVVGTTSTVNTSAGSNAASTAVVPIGTAGLAVHADFGSGGTGHVVVDTIGYITNSSAPVSEDGRYVPVRPARAFDSRATGGPLVDGQTVVVDASAADGTDVPDDASAVMWNLTVVNATRLGFASGWATDAPPPGTSLLNWSVEGEVRAAAAVTAVTSATAQFRLDDQGSPDPGPLGHLLVDVFGYFT